MNRNHPNIYILCVFTTSMYVECVLIMCSEYFLSLNSLISITDSLWDDIPVKKEQPFIVQKSKRSRSVNTPTHF